jgi:hypothetical protein
MNPYLAKLRAIDREKSLAQSPSKPSKPGFEGYDGDQRSRSFENGPRKSACRNSVQILQNTHALARAFTDLKASRAAKIDDARWHQAVVDGEAFLARWSEQVEWLGWTAEQLFGLHPTAPLARYDQMGLVWLLRGRTVVALTEKAAAIQTISGGTTSFYKFHRPALGPIGQAIGGLAPEEQG